MDHPLQLVSIPAFVALALAVIAIVGALVWLFVGQIAIEAQATGVIVNPPVNTQVTAPISGSVQTGPPLLGTIVNRGQLVAGLRTSSDRFVEVRAPIAGMVVALATGNNGTVRAGEPLLTLAPTSHPMIAYVFVPADTAAGVARGDRVTVSPEAGDTNSAGQLIGAVEEVVPLPASKERINYLVTNEQLATELTSDGPVNEVVIAFQPSAGNPSGLAWTGKGPATSQFVVSGTMVKAVISLADERPWQALLGAS